MKSKKEKPQDKSQTQQPNLDHLTWELGVDDLQQKLVSMKDKGNE